MRESIPSGTKARKNPRPGEKNHVKSASVGNKGRALRVKKIAIAKHGAMFATQTLDLG